MESAFETFVGIDSVTVLAVSGDLVVVRPVSESPSYVSLVRIPAMSMADSSQSSFLADIFSSKNILLAAQPSENGEMIGELFINGVPLAAHIAMTIPQKASPEIYPWTKVLEHAHLKAENIWIRNFYDITHFVFMVTVGAILIGVMSMRFDRNRVNRPILSRWWGRAALGWFGFGPETFHNDSMERKAENKSKARGPNG
jgi:hypothetical protein